jgi:radical SAM superfamily enzyme YgiQ (UPF0313 family)/uncharacterized protein YlaN (UPF0358 family)
MGKVKVLPVYPEFPYTFWSFKKAVEYMGKKAAMPPTGLATVMAMLPEKFEAQRIIDLNVEPLTDEQIKNSDIIFTSSMIVQEDSHNEVIDRAHYFGKKVVAGGPFPTTYPDRMDADYIVSGEAEVTLQPFLEDLLNGASNGEWTEKSVAGRGLVQLTKRGKTEITNTPLPRWDLLNLKDYHSAAIQFSRGCPFDCDFCDITKLYGKESRTKTPEQMLREFDALYEVGHRGSVFIVDDNFIGNRNHVKELLPKMKEWQTEKGFPYSFYTEASMNLAWDANEDILKGMSDVGFNFAFLGIESVDDEVLKIMHKGQNTKMSQLEAVKKIQKAGIEVSGGFIIGSDGEKPDAFEGLYNFIQEAGIATPMPGLLTAVRGTDLYKRLDSEGRIRKESDGNNTHNLHFNFEPQLDEKFLIEGYKGLIKKLFEPKNYYDRCRVLQKNIGRFRHNDRSSLEGVVAFGKSLKNQLFAKGGIEYAKYLGGTIMRNPKNFPEAVAHAIKLDHFQTITNATLEAHEYIPHTETLYEHFLEKSKKIYSKSEKDLHNRLEIISKKAGKIIRKAERKYSKLHEDFNEHAGVALNNLKNNINTLVESYKARSTARLS